VKVRYIFVLLLFVLVLGGCTTGSSESGPVISPVSLDPETGLPSGTGEFHWWNDTVFYQVFVRSFYDSSGDGNGDINGVIEKLNYLNDGDPQTDHDLGISGLWLLPIHPSPSYHGYDVLDYYDVNPDYGTLDDFRRLLDEAHKRGIRVIIDLVLNHTSEQHPWFRDSRDPDSPYRDWYIWEDENPGFIGPWGQQVWHPSRNGYYYGIFWGGMPDLNYRNPDVTKQMLDVTTFWLEKVGVDGFRVDGAQHLIEEGNVQRHTDATHEWLRGFRGFYKEINPQAVTVGEVWDTNFAVAQYVKGDQFDLAFNFDLAEAMLASANTGSARNAREGLNFTLRLFLPGQWASFLTNHDMDRVMSQLRGDENKARIAATLLMTAPGVPFVYYGEEIGMTGQNPDELIRTPMQWNAEAQAGFTTALPWQRVNRDYSERNVAAQDQDPASLLSHYRNLIGLRNNHAALRVGEAIMVDSSVPSLYSLIRTTDDEIILVLVNLSDTEVSEYYLSLRESLLSGSYRAVPLLEAPKYEDADFEPLTASPSGGFESYKPAPALPPFSSLILQFLSQ
jgi:alpha-amylase